jgi:predicted nucleic acid-binding protein
VRKVILDTDMLSEIYKEKNEVILARAEGYLEHFDSLTYTSVTASEFLFGFYAKDAKKQVNQAKAFLKANEELLPGSEDYWLVAEINGALKRTGRPIGKADPMIAACVMNRGLILATGNTRHYQFIVDAGFSFELQNWKDPQVDRA